MTVPQDENNWNQKILEIPQPCSGTEIAKTMLVRFEPVIGSTLGVVSKGTGIKFSWIETGVYNANEKGYLRRHTAI